MSLCTITFVNDGQPFEPVIYPEDLADHEDREEAAKQAAKPRLAILDAQRDFIVKIVSQTFPDAVIKQKLTVAQVRGAFVELWTKGQDWRTYDRPLANGGGSSAPSPSPASA